MCIAQVPYQGVLSMLLMGLIEDAQRDTIRKYTFNIGYLEHSTSVLNPMLNV